LLQAASMACLAPLVVSQCEAASTPRGPAAWVEFLPTDGEPGDAPLSSAELKALHEAGAIANAVKNSDCFRTVLASRRMIDTNGKAPDVVATELQALGGRVPVAFYYRCSKPSPDCREPSQALAYRQPPQGRIFVNRAHFDADHGPLDVYELAGTLAQEGFGHLLGGYDHSFAWTPSRDFSVPYSISGASPANDDAFRHCRSVLYPGGPTGR
jgi:hypothetical protein